MWTDSPASQYTNAAAILKPPQLAKGYCACVPIVYIKIIMQEVICAP